MLTKRAARLIMFALVVGPLGLACQPQWVDRGVRDNININRGDAAAGATGSGGSGPDATSSDQPDPVDAAAVDAKPGKTEPDAGVIPTPHIDAPTTDAGADGAGGAGPGAGVDARADATAEDARGDARMDTPGDATTDGTIGADPLVSALLALTPATCAMKAAGDFDLDAPGSAGAGKAAICGIKGAFYWVADMNIDCDGRNGAGSKCTGEHGNDTFAHNKDDQALAPAVTPFVVVPTSAANPDLPAVALRAGTVVAVINNQTHKIFFNDTATTENDNRIGAASYACAEQLGINPNPTTGGQKGNTVTYVAFTDPTAVPRDIENQMEARQLGQTLAAKLIIDNK